VSDSSLDSFSRSESKVFGLLLPPAFFQNSKIMENLGSRLGRFISSANSFSLCSNREENMKLNDKSKFCQSISSVDFFTKYIDNQLENIILPQRQSRSISLMSRLSNVNPKSFTHMEDSSVFSTYSARSFPQLSLSVLNNKSSIILAGVPFILNINNSTSLFTKNDPHHYFVSPFTVSNSQNISRTYPVYPAISSLSNIFSNVNFGDNNNNKYVVCQIMNNISSLQFPSSLDTSNSVNLGYGCTVSQLLSRNSLLSYPSFQPFINETNMSDLKFLSNFFLTSNDPKKISSSSFEKLSHNQNLEENYQISSNLYLNDFISKCLSFDDFFSMFSFVNEIKCLDSDYLIPFSEENFDVFHHITCKYNNIKKILGDINIIPSSKNEYMSIRENNEKFFESFLSLLKSSIDFINFLKLSFYNNQMNTFPNKYNFLSYEDFHVESLSFPVPSFFFSLPISSRGNFSPDFKDCFFFLSSLSVPTYSYIFDFINTLFLPFFDFFSLNLCNSFLSGFSLNPKKNFIFSPKLKSSSFTSSQLSFVDDSLVSNPEFENWKGKMKNEKSNSLSSSHSSNNSQNTFSKIPPENSSSPIVLSPSLLITPSNLEEVEKKVTISSFASFQSLPSFFPTITYPLMSSLVTSSSPLSDEILNASSLPAIHSFPSPLKSTDISYESTTSSIPSSHPLSILFPNKKYPLSLRLMLYSPLFNFSSKINNPLFPITLRNDKGSNSLKNRISEIDKLSNFGCRRGGGEDNVGERWNIMYNKVGRGYYFVDENGCGKQININFENYKSFVNILKDEMNNLNPFDALHDGIYNQVNSSASDYRRIEKKLAKFLKIDENEYCNEKDYIIYRSYRENMIYKKFREKILNSNKHPSKSSEFLGSNAFSPSFHIALGDGSGDIYILQFLLGFLCFLLFC
jgi:hypothetical protein